jgi:hypothetical protein
MKKCFLSFIISMIFVFFFWGNNQANGNYKYKPYPILLLHGFGSSPEGTWGTDTYVDNGDRDNRISTQIKAPYYTEDSKIFKDLHPAFEGIYDYMQSEVDIEADRFLPWEEGKDFNKESYTGYNHSYLEVFCAFYSYELRDGGSLIH